MQKPCIQFHVVQSLYTIRPVCSMMTCGMPYAVYGMEHAACGMRYAPSSIGYATCAYNFEMQCACCYALSSNIN